jgi:hypothetical protein
MRRKGRGKGRERREVKSFLRMSYSGFEWAMK